MYLELGFATFQHLSMSTGQRRILPLAFTVLQLLYSPERVCATILGICMCLCEKKMCAFVPVKFTDGSQPTDVAPAARQNGQMVCV